MKHCSMGLLMDLLLWVGRRSTELTTPGQNTVDEELRRESLGQGVWRASKDVSRGEGGAVGADEQRQRSGIPDLGDPGLRYTRGLFVCRNNKPRDGLGFAQFFGDVFGLEQEVPDSEQRGADGHTQGSGAQQGYRGPHAS